MIGAETFNVKVVVRLIAPAVPVTEMGHAPTAADELALRVNVAPQVGEQLPGANDAVTPVGRPATLNVTFWAIPDNKVAVTAFVTEEPCVTDLSPPLLSEKSMAGCPEAATMSAPIMPHQSEGTV